MIRYGRDSGQACLPARVRPRSNDGAARRWGELFGMFRVMKPVIGLLAKREPRQTVEALKSSLETTDGSAAVGAE